MKAINLSELKELELNLLKSFIDYCNDNNLKYFLCGGTALGAIRHKGFIPWDDDIDVMMPRSDYEYFINQYQNENYKVETCWKNKDYFYPFAKLTNIKTIIKEKSKMSSNIGVYIDIFPIERLPDSNIQRNIIYLKRNIYRMILFSQTATDKKRNILKSILYLLGKEMFKKTDLNKIACFYDNYARKERKNCNEYMGKVIWGYGKKEIMPAKIYNDYILCDFEGLKCRMPCDSDMYLKGLFGDYMELPPIEKRVLTHGFEAFWREK